MDTTIKNDLCPAIPLANYAQFTLGDNRRVGPVSSRMCLWCKAGYGDVVINGQSYAIQAGDYMVIPWRHVNYYRPSDREPFLLAGIHIIPWHDPESALVWSVSHDDKDELAQSPARQDRPILGLDAVVQFNLSPDHPLHLLSEYVVRHYRSSGRDPETLKELAKMVLREISLCLTTDRPRPPLVQKLERFIAEHIHMRLTIEDLADEIGRSPSQLNRLCNRHLNCTPMQWVNRMKMERACEKLRSASLSVGEVALACGFDDQFYFSRVFKQFKGMPPLVYRRKMAMF